MGSNTCAPGSPTLYRSETTSDQPFQQTTTVGVDPSKLYVLEVLRRHDAIGTFEKLAASDNPIAGFVLCMMATFYASPRYDGVGLIIDVPSKVLGPKVGINPKSLYRPIKVLEDCGALRRMTRGGSLHDLFELVMPVDPNLITTDLALSTNSAPPVGGGKISGKSSQSQQLPPPGARALFPGGGSAPPANSARAPGGGSENAVTQNPLENEFAPPGARAGSALDVDGDDEDPTSRGGKTGSELSAVMTALQGSGLPIGAIRQLALLPTTTLRVAMAVRFAVDARGVRNRGGFARSLLEKEHPEDEIDPACLARADKVLNPKVIAPAVSVRAMQLSEEEIFERQVTAYIDAASDEELEAIKLRAIESAPDEFVKRFMRKSDPRTGLSVRGFVRQLLSVTPNEQV